MSKLIADESVDSINVVPTEAEKSSRLIEIKGASELLVLTSTLGFFNESEMGYVASGVLARQGIGTNGTGFRYPTDELEPEEDPLEGVEVYNPLGEIQVSIPAFERLMSRYFRAFISEAEKRKLPIVDKPGWTEFVSAIEKIEKRI